MATVTESRIDRIQLDLEMVLARLRSVPMSSTEWDIIKRALERAARTAHDQHQVFRKQYR